MKFRHFFPVLFVFLCGCAALFGWDIHAPGMLSNNFEYRIKPMNERVALYLDPSVWDYISKNRGGKLADPQTYHVGEAYVPMIVEGFQNAFDEFIFMEAEPTPEMVKQYGIHYLAVIRINGLGNDVTMKGQGLSLNTETVVLGRDFQTVGHFVSTGSSEARKIFAKKGGPEVNLNAALENNIMSIIEYMQDSIQTGNWNK